MERHSTRAGLTVPARIVDGDFAGWLRDAMAERGMTTRVLALRTGIDHTTISRLMRGEREPKLRTAVALIQVLTRRPMRLVSAAGEAESPEARAALTEQGSATRADGGCRPRHIGPRSRPRPS